MGASATGTGFMLRTHKHKRNRIDENPVVSDRHRSLSATSENALNPKTAVDRLLSSEESYEH
jgi:hypothetical protein